MFLDDRSLKLHAAARWHPIDDNSFIIETDEDATIHEGAIFIDILRNFDKTISESELIAILRLKHDTVACYFAIGLLLKRGIIETVAEETVCGTRSHLDKAEKPHALCVTFGGTAALADIVRAAEIGAGYTIVSTNDYLLDEVDSYLRNVKVTTGTIVLIKPVGRRIWMGPAVASGEVRTVWPALRRRLLENRAMNLGFKVNPSNIRAPEMTFEEGRGRLGVELLRLTLNGREATSSLSEYRLVTFDCATLALDWHSFAPVPTLVSPKPISWRDGGLRVVDASSSLERMHHLISPVTGIARNLCRAPGPKGIFVYNADCAQPVLASVARKTTSYSGVAGKGKSDAQARVSCIAEAAERYSSAYRGDEPTIVAAAKRLDASAIIKPPDLLHFSDKQYASKASATGSNCITRVPEPWNNNCEIAWTRAWSLTKERELLVPTAHCFFNTPNRLGGRYCHADSNGCAAGNTLEEAILQGLFELIERDSCALWWYSRTRRPAVLVPDGVQPFLSSVRDYNDTLGRHIHLLDITADLGIPSVAAISSLKNDAGGILVGLGTHLIPEIAVSRALSELNQMVAIISNKNRTTDPFFSNWLRNHNFSTDAYIGTGMGHEVAFDQAAGDLVTPSSLLAECLRRLRKHNLEASFVDLTRKDVGLPVARVIVPELRHFWPRFAPGRLYDVPRRLGWVPDKFCEGDVNPTPFFL